MFNWLKIIFNNACYPRDGSLLNQAYLLRDTARLELHRQKVDREERLIKALENLK